ncbi:hypothetical protein [Flavobacterium cellulosilyticum]|uniref:Uncharacterized protein n=1 Tax=Flavobacterium cellulosilyticum TaxID=2541731 RepID=A0A4R5CHR0_9FLAO|nr:hypothetical protein [Flavobacterium cellulosilyticum]TDD98629.1 hypothetical protein E0F76_05750 [Flavobacterium cellulosilyticum]
MSTDDLKLELIAKIISINDRVLLLKISALLNDKNYTDLDENPTLINESAMKYESVRIFSTEEQRKINIALQQVENGDYISDEEAQIEIEKWFEQQE